MLVDPTGLNQAQMPDWVLRGVPDPFSDLTAYLFDPSGKDLRWISSIRRRSQILATARRTMTGQSLAKVPLQRLAQDSGVALQTIYNLVGNRDQLMGASAEQWVLAIAANGRKLAEDLDYNSTFVMVALFWSAGFAHPGYVMSAVRCSAIESAPLRQPFHRAGVTAIFEDLEQLRCEGYVRPGIDTKCVARQLTVAAMSTICQWMIEKYPTREFLRELLNGPALILAAALIGKEQGRLERAMQFWSDLIDTRWSPAL